VHEVIHVDLLVLEMSRNMASVVNLAVGLELLCGNQFKRIDKRLLRHVCGLTKDPSHSPTVWTGHRCFDY